MPGWDKEFYCWRQNLLTLINFLNSPKVESLVQMQVQEGLVKLSKEHLCPEGGLPLSGFDSLLLGFTIDPIHNFTDSALRERLVDSLSHWTDPNARRGDQKTRKNRSIIQIPESQPFENWTLYIVQLFSSKIAVVLRIFSMIWDQVWCRPLLWCWERHPPAKRLSSKTSRLPTLTTW